MANPHRGEAVLSAAGREYTLAFTINAMCAVEGLLGQSTDQILASLVEGPPLTVVRALLWGGLQANHPDVDLLASGDIIEALGGAGEALGVIGGAMSAAFPEAETGGDTARP